VAKILPSLFKEPLGSSNQHDTLIRHLRGAEESHGLMP